MKDNKTPNLLEGRTKEWDYYNRPSLHTSYKMAVIAIIMLILTVMGLMVSEVVKDFDYTSHKDKQETIGEISY